jgi:hypothetical protein
MDEAARRVLERALVCRLGLVREGRPYVVPVCFCIHEGALYFHSRPHGTKMDCIDADSHVCFEVDIDHELRRGRDHCTWSMGYKSVIGEGRARRCNGKEKERALGALVEKYANEPPKGFSHDELDAVAVVRIDIEQASVRTR